MSLRERSAAAIDVASDAVALAVLVGGVAGLAVCAALEHIGGKLKRGIGDATTEGTHP